nr:hypothetical protein [Tanacetum cinerariifolium]
MVKRSGYVTRLQALVDKKKIVISEDVIHEILRLDDAEGVVCLPNEEIFAGLAQMGYEKHDLISQDTSLIAWFEMLTAAPSFIWVETPLFETMLVVRDVAEEAEAQILAQGNDVQEHAEEDVATDVLDTCYALVLRVEGLENANAAQQLE